MIDLPRDRMDQVLKRFELIETQMAAGPEPDVYVKLASEYSELQEVAGKIRELRQAEAELDDLKSMLADPATDKEMRELAEADVEGVEGRIETLGEEMQILLLPKDEADDKNAILEIRAGTGGDEAALFAGDLFRMYERYAAEKGWRVEVVSVSEGEAGGYKEIIATVSGRGVFSRLKFESGVHRVQRVPATEAQGRIHTSAATVAVLPEAKISTSISSPTTSALIRCALRVRADSTSTPPIRRCASPYPNWHCRAAGGEVSASEPGPRHADPAGTPL